MARPLRLHIPQAFYHVLSRGNAKQAIFVGDADYEQFLDLLSTTSSRFGVRCHAYCLMSNHFHLLLQPDASPLSPMMQQLNSAYSQSFNRRHDRVGHVLQGRFKALLVDRDDYFLQLVRYISLNPVEAGVVDEPRAWRWSSYRATAGLTEAPTFLVRDDVWRMFASSNDEAQRRFVAFVDAGRGQLSLLSEAIAFGSAAFKALVGAVLEPHREVRAFPRRERFAVRPALETLFVQSHDSASRRQAMAEAYWRHGYTLREIAAHVGLHESTVWWCIKRAMVSDVVAAGSGNS